MPKFQLEKIDSAFTGKFKDRDEAQKETDKLLERLYGLLYMMYAQGRHSLLIILQGIDASGKDGTVRSLFSGANPQGIRVYSFKKPSEEELKHDILWRCHKHAPARGFAAIFNRSYYEEVSTVRVHPEMLLAQGISSGELKGDKLFRARFRQINDFEQMLSDNGTVVLKFFLHISKKEQKERLEERIKDPSKHWKFSAQDLVERKFWEEYMEAFGDMMSATHTKTAPWHVVPADHKWYRNFVVAKAVVEALEGLSLSFPKSSIDKKHKKFR